MNFTLLPSSSFLIHSSSGMFVAHQARSVFSSSLRHVPKMVSQCRLHRRSNTQTTLHAAEEEGDADATAAWPFLFCGVDRKSTRLNSSHQIISYAVFCLKKII